MRLTTRPSDPPLAAGAERNFHLTERNVKRVAARELAAGTTPEA